MFEHQVEGRLRGGNSDSVANERFINKHGAADRRDRRKRKKHLDRMDEISNQLTTPYAPHHAGAKEDQVKFQKLENPKSMFNADRMNNRRTLADAYEMTKRTRRNDDDSDDEDVDLESREDVHEENTDLIEY
ncbi:ribonuclease [Acrasis kona]|uniref:Ribonuclease n=1 Tax=Acrasis kona TaxID=1008807 RepID=A0AAW2YWK3_9EUKA